MSRLDCQIVKRNDLKENEITAMYKLTEATHVNSNPTEFLLELAQMDYVFLFRNALHEIKGFQEQKIVKFQERGQKVRGVFIKEMVMNEQDSINTDIIAEIEKLYERYIRKYKKFYLFATAWDGQLFQMFYQSGKIMFPNERIEMPDEYKTIRKLAGRNLYQSQYNDKTGEICYRYGRKLLYITELTKKEKN